MAEAGEAAVRELVVMMVAVRATGTVVVVETVEAEVEEAMVEEGMAVEAKAG